MAKLLYLVHRIPFPPNKGDKIRSFHFLKALAQRYEIYLGTFVDEPDDWQYVADLKAICQEVYALSLNPRLYKLKSLSGFLTGEALSVPYYHQSAMQQWVDQTVSAQNIDKALIFSSPMAQYLRSHQQIRWVADFVDVDSDKWRQYSSSKTWPASWVYRREAEKLLAFETQMAAIADATIFVSEQEAKLFQGLAPEQAHKIGFVNNGVDTAFFDPDRLSVSPYDSGQLAIVFTGAMDYWANVDAVKWFAEQVLPLIRQRQPAARFYIVGSKPDAAVLQLAQLDDAVVVTGRVEDVRPYVAHAHLVVAPLRIARGIQNKVLEAMAMAKPVVVTAAAMEGISIDAGLSLWVEDDPSYFADRVLTILSEPVLRADRNRAFVQAEFAWEQNGQRLCDLLAHEGTGQ